MLTVDEKWAIARLALLGLTFLPSVALGLCTLFLARSRGDPARTWTRLLKLAFLLFVAQLVFNIVAYAIYLDIELASNADMYTPYDHDLQAAANQLFLVGSLLDYLSEIALFLVFTFLGAGIERVIHGQEPARYAFIKPTAYVISVILSILAVADWAVGIRTYLGFENHPTELMFATLLNAYVRLGFAINVLLTALSLAVVGGSIMVTLGSSWAKRCKSAAAAMLVCSVLWLLGRCYVLATSIKYNNLSDPYDGGRVLDSYIPVLDVILYLWPLLVLFVVLFALGQKKANGVWSTEQPFLVANPGMTPYQGQPQGYYNQYGYQQPYTYHEVAQFGARSPLPPRAEVMGSVQPPPTELAQPYRTHEVPA